MAHTKELIQIMVFWVLSPYNFVHRYYDFGEICSLYFHPYRGSTFLKNTGTHPHDYTVRGCRRPHLNTHCHENLKYKTCYYSLNYFNRGMAQASYM
jgi:hypothetical protein